MRTVLAAAITLALGAGPAHALCVVQPDDAASRYVENNTAQTICLHNELAETQRRLSEDAERQIERARIEADLRRFQMLQTEALRRF